MSGRKHTAPNNAVWADQVAHAYSQITSSTPPVPPGAAMVSCFVPIRTHHHEIGGKISLVITDSAFTTRQSTEDKAGAHSLIKQTISFFSARFIFRQYSTSLEQAKQLMALPG